jgi:hypothetical protein
MKKPKPTIFAAMEAINHDDELDKSEKNVLRAMLRYASMKTGECWPSIATLADDLGMTARGVQKIIARITEKGRLIVVFQSKGGISRTTGQGIPNRWRLNLRPSPGKRKRRTPNASAENPEPQCNNPEPEGGEPRTVFGQTTMNHPKEEAIEQPCGNGSLSLMGNAKAGKTESQHNRQQALRTALMACGVEGFNLNLLAGSQLTADDVRREWKTIQYRPDIQRKPGVLVHRLKAKCGMMPTEGGSTSVGKAAANEAMRAMQQRIAEGPRHF